jgi:hypothetical protein
MPSVHGPPLRRDPHRVLAGLAVEGGQFAGLAGLGEDPSEIEIG